MRRAILAVAIALTACAGNSAQADTTTTTVSPDDAFVEALRDPMRLADLRPDAPLVALDVAKDTCGSLTDVGAVIANGEAPADSPASDQAVTRASQQMELGILMDQSHATTPAVDAAILRAMAEHLCPEHTTVVEDFLDQRGL